MAKNTNLALIQEVANALGDLLEHVVFVGGSTVLFYIDDEAAPTPSPSEDVDCIIEVPLMLSK